MDDLLLLDSTDRQVRFMMFKGIYDWPWTKMLGLLLPPSVPGALVNFAALLSGKVPVNLSHTVSEETLAACIGQCQIKTVVTSRGFLDRLKIKVSGEVVFLEDVVGAPISDPARGENSPKDAGLETGAPSALEKITATLMAWLLPASLLERAFRHANKVKLDDLATVIFSCGSTGNSRA